MSNGSTAVSTEVAGIGRSNSIYKREINALHRTISGLNWGPVAGSSFSPQAQYEIARFCHVTKANPMIHVDILGGKPYLNAGYYSDLVNQHPHFHHYEQWDISPSVEEKLREMGLTDKADEIAFARMKWSPPKEATVVVQTTIYRFINSAPLDMIKAGKIENIDQYIVPVAECNWAGGGQKDPVGNANPATTARTRSFRRAATKAFSAWMEPFEVEIRKAEEIIDAEFTIIQEDAAERRSALPAPGEAQAVNTSHGEPTAANAVDAEPLPMDDETDEERMGREAKAAEALKTPPVPVEEPESEDAFDRNDARKKFFATLNDAGLTKRAEQKAWAVKQGLPESSKEYTKEQYDTPERVFVDPIRERVKELCELQGLDLHDLSLQIVGKDTPEYLRDWNALDAYLAEEDGEL